MGLCFENAEKELITGNVLIFSGTVWVGFIYLHSISVALQKSFVLFFCSAQLFCKWEWQFAMHNPIEEALAAVLCPRCNVTPSAVTVVLAKNLAPILQKHS